MIPFSIQLRLFLFLTLLLGLAGCATSEDATDIAPGSATPAPTQDPNSGWGLKAEGTGN